MELVPELMAEDREAGAEEDGGDTEPDSNGDDGGCDD